MRRISVNKETSVNQVTVSRPRVTLLMILCGIVSASAAGAVSAATPGDEVPTLVVRYRQDSLETASGARALYHRLERAAEQVCPAVSTGSPFLSSAIVECRQQSIARAVYQINNPRLAAVYSANAKRG
jgi:UrcA family protein